MHPDPPTILFLAPYFDPRVAAGIRCSAFADALASLPVRLLLVTRGPRAALESLGRDGLICRIDPAGRLPADLTPLPQSRWPRPFLLPGPDPQQAFCRAAFRAAHALAARHRPDLVLASAPPFALLTIARHLADHYRARLALDLRDAWYTAMPWPYPHALSRSSARREEAHCLGRADHVFSATDTLRQLLVDAHHPLSSDKITTVRHGFAPPLDNAGPLPSPMDAWSDKFLVVHVGQLRGLDTPRAPRISQYIRIARRVLMGARFLENLHIDWMSPRRLFAATRQIVQSDAECAHRLRFVFVGAQYRELDTLAAEYGLAEHVVQLGPRDPDITQRITARADLLALFLYGISGQAYHWCVPSKTYSYLSAGRPILALLPPGEARDIVQRANVALPADPTDVAAIANQLRKAYAIWKNDAPPLQPDRPYIQTFRRDTQLTRFLSNIRPLLAI